jgi:hypothetical protein
MKRSFILSVVLVFLTFAAIARASTINLCYPEKFNAALHSTLSSGACASKFLLEEINKEGPEGKEGPRGERGPAGPPGEVGPETVGDSQVVKGRALLATNNSYQPQQLRSAETEYEPSATRSVFVVLTLASDLGGSYFSRIEVNGVQIGRLTSVPVSEERTEQTISFIVPPGQKWKIKAGGEVEEIRTSYLVL